MSSNNTLIALASVAIADEELNSPKRSQPTLEVGTGDDRPGASTDWKSDSVGRLTRGRWASAPKPAVAPQRYSSEPSASLPLSAAAVQEEDDEEGDEENEEDEEEEEVEEDDEEWKEDEGEDEDEDEDEDENEDLRSHRPSRHSASAVPPCGLLRRGAPGYGSVQDVSGSTRTESDQITTSREMRVETVSQRQRAASAETSQTPFVADSANVRPAGGSSPAVGGENESLSTERYGSELFLGSEASDDVPEAPPLTVDNAPAILTSEKCTYTENCTTGSPLRKVVSHIFGRNKLCTRRIPGNAWVHYCRKHYQRSRYRNPRGFALLQCDLVRKQIDRLQLWGGVIDWAVKVRKRELERLNRENAQLELERLSQAGRRSSNKAAGGRANRKNSNSSAAAPANATATATQAIGPARSWTWLIQCTGTGKTAAEILEILERIESEIAVSGSSFPDVEVLPNVMVNGKARLTSSSQRTSRRTSRRGSGVPSSSSPSASQDGAADQTYDAVAATRRPDPTRRKRTAPQDFDAPEVPRQGPPTIANFGVGPIESALAQASRAAAAGRPELKRPRLRGRTPKFDENSTLNARVLPPPFSSQTAMPLQGRGSAISVPPTMGLEHDGLVGHAFRRNTRAASQLQARRIV